MDANGSLSRRGFIAATTGAAAAGAAGAAAAQEETDGGATETEGTPAEGTEGDGTETGEQGTEGGESTEGEGTEGEGTEGEGGEDGGGGGGGVPDFGSYLQDANGYSEGDVADERGSDEVTVDVGAGDGLAFDPPAVWVDPGTTVVWEWTGEGGGHNVATEEGEADLSSEIVSDEGHTFEHEFTEEEAGITTYKCEPHEGQGMKGGVAVGDDVPTVDVGGGGEAAVEIPDQAMALSLATAMAMGSTLALGYVFMKYGGEPPRDEE